MRLLDHDVTSCQSQHGRKRHKALPAAKHPAEKPSKRKNILDLPLELREHIWGHALATENDRAVIPVDTRTREELRRDRKDTLPPEDCVEPVLYDRPLLRTNAQIRHEATLVLLRNNRVLIKEDLISQGLLTRSVKIKERLTHILQHARRLTIQMRDPQADTWYIDALKCRTNIHYLGIIFLDTCTTFAAHWDSDKEAAKESLLFFKDIKVRGEAKIRYYDEIWGSEERAPRATRHEIRRFLIKEIMPAMMWD